MNLSLLFWLALMLPGYVLVRRLAGDDLKSGLLGTVAVSYVAVLGLLSPVSILCYVLHAPVAVFSAACLAAILAAVAEITRRRWWPDLGKLIIAAASVELLIIVVDLVMGGLSGAHLDGDTRVHLARIRFLLDHGFNNCDPFIAGGYFFPIYHTNILHAVYAACGQITGVDHFGVWFASLVWGKLLIASGTYFLVWTVFDRHWPAWLAAVCVVGIHGPINFIIYPNKLAPFWLVPCLVGFAVQALTRPCTWRSSLKLGVGSLLLGQVHGLYATVGFIVLAPVFGAVGLFKIVRKKPGRWRLATCFLVLAVGLPFPLVSKLTTAGSSSGAGAVRAASPAPPGFLKLDNGWVMKDPRRGFGGGGWRFGLLALGVAASLATSRRRQAGVVVAVVVVLMFVLYAPPACSALLAVVGQPWILGRFEFILRMGLIVLLIPAIAFWLEPRIRLWTVRGILAAGVFFLAITSSDYTKMHNWTTYRQKAFAARQERLAKLTKFRQFRDVLFKGFVPPGETVLTNLEAGLSAVMLYDCRIVAGARASNGVPDIALRRADVRVMVAKDTPWPQRQALLHKYGIRYFWPSALWTTWARPRCHEWRNVGDDFFMMKVKTD